MNPFFDALATTLSFMGLLSFLLLLGKLAKDFFTPYKIDLELVKHDNFAIAVSMSGYYVSIVIIFIGSLLGSSTDLATDLLTVGGYTLLGIVFLNSARVINDRIVFRKFCSDKNLMNKHNVGIGALQFGSYIATGFVAAASLYGEGGDFTSAIVFFSIGQIILCLFGFIYNLITPFDIQKEIEQDNVAVGISFGGTQIALGIIMARGLGHNFVDWNTNILWFGEAALIGIIALPLIRIFMDRFIIPTDSLNKEIQMDRNIGAGLLESSIAISFSSALFFLL